jgi:hypothetical protein
MPPVNDYSPTFVVAFIVNKEALTMSTIFGRIVYKHAGA